MLPPHSHARAHSSHDCECTTCTNASHHDLFQPCIMIHHCRRHAFWEKHIPTFDVHIKTGGQMYESILAGPGCDCVPAISTAHIQTLSRSDVHTTSPKTYPEAFVMALMLVELQTYQFGILLGQCTGRRKSNKAFFSYVCADCRGPCDYIIQQSVSCTDHDLKHSQNVCNVQKAIL